MVETEILGGQVCCGLTPVRNLGQKARARVGLYLWEWDAYAHAVRSHCQSFLGRSRTSESQFPKPSLEMSNLNSGLYL